MPWPLVFDGAGIFKQSRPECRYPAKRFDGLVTALDEFLPDRGSTSIFLQEREYTGFSELQLVVGVFLDDFDDPDIRMDLVCVKTVLTRLQCIDQRRERLKQTFPQGIYVMPTLKVVRYRYVGGHLYGRRSYATAVDDYVFLKDLGMDLGLSQLRNAADSIRKQAGTKPIGTVRTRPYKENDFVISLYRYVHGGLKVLRVHLHPKWIQERSHHEGKHGA